MCRCDLSRGGIAVKVCGSGISLVMSQRALPILFLNLGGEMLYILDQRLRAQNIPEEKARKGDLQKLTNSH